MTVDELKAFETEVANRFEAREIRAPIHLSGGNENELIDIFRAVPRDAWIFSTWRSHLHALLHGVPPDLLMADIISGKSMFLHYPKYRFFTSAIVGGILPIACGVAMAGEPVWCFVGDMTASIGAFRDAEKFANGYNLPINFVIEDNGLATNSPTAITWGLGNKSRITRYTYQRTWPHVGSRQYVAF
jgi:pyruvate dehydrogenase E1 component alpha subunit